MWRIATPVSEAERTANRSGEHELHTGRAPDLDGIAVMFGRTFSSQFTSVLRRSRQFGSLGRIRVWLSLGNFDAPSAFTPEYHYAVETQLHWLPDDGLPRFRLDEDENFAAAMAAARDRPE